MEDNKITIFENEEFGKVRTIIKNGEPWFVGKDVASALGYADTFGALKKHAEDEDKLVCQIDSAGQRREVTVINESGLYSLILSSKLPTAKKFKHWVTSEVLPTIRKTGGYIQIDRGIEFINNYFPSFTDDTKKAMLVDLYKKNAELSEEIKVNQPKLNSYNTFLNSKGHYSTREVAKHLCVPEQALISLLIEKKYLYRDKNKRLMPYADKCKCGYMKLKTTTRGDLVIDYPVITPRGAEAIRRLCEKCQIQMVG